MSLGSGKSSPVLPGYESEGSVSSFCYLNRELSWLEFNSRVLQLAADKRIPLLERLRFLSIFSSNLDEFFMKRVGSLKRRLDAGLKVESFDGKNAEEQLELIRGVAISLLVQSEEIFGEDIKPALSDIGIELLHWSELSNQEKAFANSFFEREVFPILTPFAVDAGSPFPLVSNLSTSLGVMLAENKSEESFFVRVKMSGIVPQWLQVEVEGEKDHFRFVSLREVISVHADNIFPDMNVHSKMPFRVTRNAELEIDEEKTEDLRSLVQRELREQRYAKVVRLEHGPNPDQEILGFLMEELELEEQDVYQHQGELEYSTLTEVADLSIAEHRYPSWSPAIPAEFVDESSLFSVIKNKDVLVHHPFESFAFTVERFIREAAEDPKVVSIKMTVYRVGDQTPLIPLLIQAAESGKQVVVVVEIKARFDEERNIQWARTLEQAGVHVLFGFPSLKVHAKSLLIVRKEPEGPKCYAHIGTGNYNAATANHYTDLGLFTSRTDITEDLVYFFNYLSGRARKDRYKKLLISPINMRDRFLELIREEASLGEKGRIIARMNGLQDKEMIHALYAASMNGVKIDLVVRGMCCLRPGVEGLSENIRVTSILGRFLEHSRVFYFGNGKSDPLDGIFYIGSADWMERNLSRRVELCVPIEDLAAKRIIWELFEINLRDRSSSWELSSDGTYSRLSPTNCVDRTDSQERLMLEYARKE